MDTCACGAALHRARRKPAPGRDAAQRACPQKCARPPKLRKMGAAICTPSRWCAATSTAAVMCWSCERAARARGQTVGSHQGLCVRATVAKSDSVGDAHIGRSCPARAARLRRQPGRAARGRARVGCRWPGCAALQPRRVASLRGYTRNGSRSGTADAFARAPSTRRRLPSHHRATKSKARSRPARRRGRHQREESDVGDGAACGVRAGGGRGGRGGRGAAAAFIGRRRRRRACPRCSQEEEETQGMCGGHVHTPDPAFAFGTLTRRRSRRFSPAQGKGGGGGATAAALPSFASAASLVPWTIKTLPGRVLTGPVFPLSRR